ncbi:MAG: hypothetical protein KDC44_17160 [Phaeodactylibacter sp.]|nr:hypothetical protein [Phaeodactylibacter sp.]
MSENLTEQFIEKLEQQYGPLEKMTSRFGNATFGKIAKDLCISASQFSKLIYGTATEGMYIRSMRNVDRLMEEQQALDERDALQVKLEAEQAHLQQMKARQGHARRRSLLLAGLALLLGGCIVYFFKKPEPPVAGKLHPPTAHPLSLYFDQDFDAAFHSPYLKESEVQDYCPCNAYEGEWSLSETYKLPLPGNRKPGVYYLAKSADVRMKCSKIDTLNGKRGRVLHAYEYLVNEIWVDSELTPLSPTYFDKESMQYTPEFESLNFEDSPQFKKVATIHSFFIDKFEIFKDSIVRRGEPAGRFATDIDQALVETYEIDLKHVLTNVLGDLTTTACQAAPNPYCDPNELRAHESVISFDCLYTIKAANLGIGGGYPYRKGYRLEHQSYSDNLTCVCR